MIPLAFHKVNNRLEWGLTWNTIGGFRRIVEYLERIDYSCPQEQFEISFDDGYESVYTNAFPILKNKHLRAMVFVVVGYIGKKSDWDIYPGSDKFSHLSKHQLMDLHNNGILIGSHTMNHKSLISLDKKRLIYELSESKKVLEDIFGEPIESISYPFGRYNKRVMDTAVECGYKYGYTFFKNNLPIGVDDHKDDYSDMSRQRVPIYLFDTPLSIMLKWSKFGGLERLKGKIIKSYNIYSGLLGKNRETK